MTICTHHQEYSNPDSLLTESQTAQYLNFTPRCLQAWRQRGGGPKYVRISSRAIRYRKIDLDNWIEERLKTSTSED